MMRSTDAISSYLGFRPSDLIANIDHDVFGAEVLLTIVSIGGTLEDIISHLKDSDEKSSIARERDSQATRAREPYNYNTCEIDW